MLSPRGCCAIAQNRRGHGCVSGGYTRFADLTTSTTRAEKERTQEAPCHRFHFLMPSPGRHRRFAERLRAIV
jgi:hypothetical protein